MKISGMKNNLPVLSGLILSAAIFVSGFAQAVQNEAQFKTAYRSSATGLKLGVIQPDADLDSRNFMAQRYVYGDSARPTLVTQIESGSLVYWMDETVTPAQWTNFTVFSTRAFEYDNYGRKIKEWI